MRTQPQNDKARVQASFVGKASNYSKFDHTLSSYETQSTSTLGILKLRELATILPLSMPAELSGELRQCDCCDRSPEIGTMYCVPGIYGSKVLISWLCRDCIAKAKANGGETIQRGSEIAWKDIDHLLLSSAHWLDAEIFKRNKNQPFVRRPLLAEIQRVQSTGQVVPEGAAVVVTRHDGERLRRQSLPIPFPWHDDNEFLAGPSAAKEAMAMAKMVKTGHAEVFMMPGGAMLMTCDTTALRKVARAGVAT
jgi:hypothetical protein